MRSLLPRVDPPRIIEDKGPDFFEPAHPEPLSGPRNYLKLFLLARQDYLSVFRRRDYSSRNSEMRRFGRQLVLVNAPEEVKYVLATRNDNFERKSPQMRRALEYLLGDGLFISDGETWKQRRPLVSDIVHKNRVPQFSRHMVDCSAELSERWSGLEKGQVVDVLAEMAGLTAEIISRAVFGDDLGRESATEVVEGFGSYQSLVDNINLAYVLGFDNGLPLLRTPRLRRAVMRVRRVIDRVVSAHLEGRTQDDSMIELLIRRQRRNPELGLDGEALRNEAATIFMAGHETTAATLTWAWYLLANAPWAETALHAEIERVCGTRPPGIDDVPQLDYCRSIIEETLRLYPPVPLLGRQARDATGSATSTCGRPPSSPSRPGCSTATTTSGTGRITSCPSASSARPGPCPIPTFPSRSARASAPACNSASWNRSCVWPASPSGSRCGCARHFGAADVAADAAAAGRPAGHHPSAVRRCAPNRPRPD
ncbi:Pentalenene oxygenase [Methylobrevis pamukkalensis]|uniref:Pentalenene oxygenase n=1 Tax=Methylobrevis pamukkalensis TaxID=1439726 RepID=A0A1E3H4P6_9HYPH|nr:Pentalenene oxygenase [Methylobrevis pamukkalensis]